MSQARSESKATRSLHGQVFALAVLTALYAYVNDLWAHKTSRQLRALEHELKVIKRRAEMR